MSQPSCVTTRKITLYRDDLVSVRRASDNDFNRTAAPDNLFFKSSLLSKNHAILSYTNSKVYIQDTESSFGTVLNNKYVNFGSKVEIKDGDSVGFVIYKPYNFIRQKLDEDAYIDIDLVPLSVFDNPDVLLPFVVSVQRSSDESSVSVVFEPIENTNRSKSFGVNDATLFEGLDVSDEVRDVDEAQESEEDISCCDNTAPIVIEDDDEEYERESKMSDVEDFYEYDSSQDGTNARGEERDEDEDEDEDEEVEDEEEDDEVDDSGCETDDSYVNFILKQKGSKNVLSNNYDFDTRFEEDKQDALVEYLKQVSKNNQDDEDEEDDSGCESEDSYVMMIPKAKPDLNVRFEEDKEDALVEYLQHISRKNEEGEEEVGDEDDEYSDIETGCVIKCCSRRPKTTGQGRSELCQFYNKVYEEDTADEDDEYIEEDIVESNHLVSSKPPTLSCTKSSKAPGKVTKPISANQATQAKPKSSWAKSIIKESAKAALYSTATIVAVGAYGILREGK
ncbi:hypothetical protein PSN45_001082 [Yamadazyma tenuis]|nr:hypothetical protein PSN45_001082 [Yamadazyma tenuis]